uniref:RNA-binding S4 domain-containing protein n=1 Tax=Stappia sp. TaxID=1870903 RepID=UPI003BA8FEB1
MGSSTETGGGASAPAQRVDKWLWFARVVKSRSLAQKLVAGGHVRINRDKTTTPSKTVRAGDVLTVAVAERILVMKVLLPGTRRGPAPEAQTLYELISPLPAGAAGTPGGADEGSVKDDGSGRPLAAQGRDPARRERGSGRPTKRDRRATDRLRGDWS